ncbi:MAG: carbohydrate ABC transporter permease [Propionibacteriaceae bacterium]|jgi:multiple sugar transport system permease protein|nr:carbohydrate ABC transporter permease [Propionibacteriaceae bacterium]
MTHDTYSAARQAGLHKGRRLLMIYLGYILAIIVFVLPILFLIWSAFRRNVDVTGSVFSFGQPLTLDNFVELFQRFKIAYYLRNSFIIAGTSTVLGILLGVPAAYAIVRRQLAAAGFITLLARMAPGIIFLIPLFQFAVNIGAMRNVVLNFMMLIAAHLIVTLPLSIWLMIPFFEEVPVALEESAMIDGCSPLRRLVAVMLPLVAPGVAVAILISFIFSWNYFLFALALGTSNTMPLTVIAFNFIGEGSADFGGLMAASLIISLPALVLSLVAQRWLVRGLTGGAVK